MITQLSETEILIMNWYFQFNNRIDAVMTAPQFNNFRANIVDEEILSSLHNSFKLLVEKKYLTLDNRNNYALTLKGFNYINNR